MTVAVVGYRQETNRELAAAWRARGLDAKLVAPADALAELDEGDVALGRLDVRPGLDGVESGLATLDALESKGVTVLNRASALLAAHDKLLTQAALVAAGVPHPRTTHVHSAEEAIGLPLPVVLKPRFGSWGRDVVRCTTPAELAASMRELETRPWFRKHGVLVQELFPPPGFDLRLIVAGGGCVGAIERVAKAGEWRTNISLGGTLRRATVSPEACALGAAAAAALGADLVGVDLLPADGGWVVLELNGAVEFDGRYSLGGGDVYRASAEALRLSPPTLTAANGRAAS